MNLLERKTAELKQAQSWDDIYNVLASAFGDTPSAHPLYDQLVAGDFNDFTHEKFADMCGRIAAEENIHWKALHQLIIVYVQENDPYGGYNSDAFGDEPAASAA